MKRRKLVQVQIKALIDLKQYLLPFTLPPTLALVATAPRSEAQVLALEVSEATNHGVMWIPMDDVYCVEGAVLTGPMQIQWMGQLMKLRLQFVFHIDSKFKLHHGEWVMTSLGVHHLKWDAHNLKISTQYVPLVYRMCKQHESNGAALMIMDALNVTTMKYYGEKLEPGACMSDHCDAFKRGFEVTWPEAEFGTCWPHIARKFGEGEYTTKKWEHFEEVKVHLRNIHMAHTPQMRDELMMRYGTLWDGWGGQMNTFWTSYCAEASGWDCWSIGLFETVLCTPSQQAQESWHKQLLRTKIPNMMRGSTESVFKVALPQLVLVDAIQIPTELVFHVPAVPKKMIKKALWYVDHQDSHVNIYPWENGDYGYYILRKDNPGGVKKLTKRLIEMYEQANAGHRDRRVVDLEHFEHVCFSLHQILPENEPRLVPECDLNPRKLDCLYCKGFKGVGICSHVLAINHILKEINLRREVMEIGASSSRKDSSHNGKRIGGGNRKAPIPALTRAPTRDADSSDEEQERLLELGDNGR